MRTLLSSFSAFALLFGGEPDSARDPRVEQRHGYHIITAPARKGETPPEVKQEKAEDDSRRKRDHQDLGEQAPPTRQPELKPKDIKP